MSYQSYNQKKLYRDSSTTLKDWVYTGLVIAMGFGALAILDYGCNPKKDEPLRNNSFTNRLERVLRN